jgi:hypothetical protein
MAWLEQRPSGQFHVAFRFGELRCKKSLRTQDPEIAEARLHRLEENIRLVESGRLTIPDDADVASFMLSDGKMNGRVKRPSIRFLGELLAKYLAEITEGSIEENTLVR